jgi:hypothetical protein
MWHLMSLDAPTVAMLWTWFVARAGDVRLPLSTAAAMGLAVWILYAADRLLDTRGLDALRGGAGELEARHYFHHRYRGVFTAGIVLAGAVLAAMLPRLNDGAMHLYGVEGVLLVAWFWILHATHSAHRLPKEMAVGLFFSAAVFIPTVARDPGLRLRMLPDAVLFAALCSLNCLFIYAWEHSARQLRRAHPSTRLAVGHLTMLACAVAVAGAALTLLGPIAERPIAAACTLSQVLLLLLNSQRRRLSGISLRAAADLALLTPILLLPFLQ